MHDDTPSRGTVVGVALHASRDQSTAVFCSKYKANDSHQGQFGDERSNKKQAPSRTCVEGTESGKEKAGTMQKNAADLGSSLILILFKLEYSPARIQGVNQLGGHSLREPWLEQTARYKSRQIQMHLVVGDENRQLFTR